MKWIFFALLLSSNVWAKNHMLVLGGGGEPRNAPQTMFDLDLSLVGDFKKRRPLIGKRAWFLMVGTVRQKKLRANTLAPIIRSVRHLPPQITINY